MTTSLLLDRMHSTDPNDWPIYSYSQLQSWDRCETLWDYAYPRNWARVRKQEALSLGSEIHLSFKNWYDMAIQKIPKDERKAIVLKYFTDKLKTISDDMDYLPVLERAMWLSMRYFNEFAPVEDKGHKILKTEYHFTVPFVTGKGRHFILQGYIDLLTQYQDRLWAWDHKSSEGQFWTPVQVMMEPQTPLYAAALREQGENVHGVIINMINTYNYKKPHGITTDKLFRRETAYRSSIELDTFVREMKFTVDDIAENHQTPRRSLRLDCKNCSFQEPCLLRIKGIDDRPLLQSEFFQKEKVNVPVNFEPKRLMSA